MTRGELRQHVRDLLGEPGPRGFWDDDELNRYIQLESNRHAQEALSVEAQVNTSSVPGVIDYALPDDFGELKEVRYIQDVSTGPEGLIYVNRQDILEQLGEIDTVGDPYMFYRWAGFIGLYPVPHKPPLLQNTFMDVSDRPARYVPLVTGHEQGYHTAVEWALEDNPDRPFYRVFVSHISVYLRRDQITVPGDITLLVRDGDADYFQRSEPVPASYVDPIGGWIHFDFSDSMIEVRSGTPTTYQLAFDVTAAYVNATDKRYGNRIEIAVNRQNNHDIAYFQLHQVKDDIEIDYYRNTTDPLTTDDASIEIPARYDRTLIKMVAVRAMQKERGKFQQAVLWDSQVTGELQYARSQAMVKTLGRVLRAEQFRNQGRRGYMTYRGDGRFYGRL